MRENGTRAQWKDKGFFFFLSLSRKVGPYHATAATTDEEERRNGGRASGESINQQSLTFMPPPPRFPFSFHFHPSPPPANRAYHKKQCIPRFFLESHEGKKPFSLSLTGKKPLRVSSLSQSPSPGKTRAKGQTITAVPKGGGGAKGDTPRFLAETKNIEGKRRKQQKGLLPRGVC